MDSSVIFLVVIGLWAAYLVPHWLRRREDLSASRSVDRFSAAMRVLTRRPAREQRPDHQRTSAYVLAPTAGRLAIGSAPVAAAATAAAAPAAAPAQRRGSVVRRARRPRVLATLLGLALVAVPVLVLMAVVGVAPAWAPLPVAALALVLVGALRARARRRRRARRARDLARSEPTSVLAGAGTRRPSAQVEHAQVEQDQVEDGADEDATDEPFDEQRHTALEEQARIRRLAEEALRAADVPYREPEPGEWTPVAVPLPSYLLKPHAPHARPSMLLFEQDEPTRRLDVDDDDIPTYAPPSRRAAGA